VMSAWQKAELSLPLYPFDVEFLRESLSGTGRLLVVEEGQGFVSMSGEILAQVAERADMKGVSSGRVTAAPVPIPSARPLESECLPDVEAIVARALEIVGGC